MKSLCVNFCLPPTKGDYSNAGKKKVSVLPFSLFCSKHEYVASRGHVDGAGLYSIARAQEN